MIYRVLIAVILATFMMSAFSKARFTLLSRPESLSSTLYICFAETVRRRKTVECHDSERALV